MTTILTAIKPGYAYVIQNERGHFFSEGNYDILGAPRTDGDDALSWISSQPWSNTKVGTTGCSSTAEYQMGIAAMGNPAHAAMNVQGFGAGVGRVAPYYEQGNWYRGGAVQMLFIAWLYGEQNQVRPMFPGYGSCLGTTFRLARILLFSIMSAKTPRARSPTSSGPSSLLSRTAPTHARPKTPSSENAAWAMPGLTIRKLSIAFLTASSKAIRARGSMRFRKSRTTRWASTSGSLPTLGRSPAHTR